MYVSSDASVPPAENGRGAVTATDGELLMRFARHRDSQAFAQIVERHGGLVWIVCREVLRHHQDVEDAFQATFFILAERAATIRSSDSAAAWLYKVAQRTSLAARRQRSRRREEELIAEPPQGDEARPLIHDQHMIYVLMEELRSLPARYQSPLVLRYLEGRSRRAIAEQTDSTIAQIQGRLVRGRRLLRSRLARRGVSLSLAAGVATSMSAKAGAAVTPALVAGTTKNCVSLIASGAAGGATSAALELAKQGVKAMWLASLTKTTVVISTMLVVAGVAWAVERGVGGGKSGADATPAAKVVALESGAAAGTTEAPAADAKNVAAGSGPQRAADAEQLLARRIAESQDVFESLVDAKVSKSADVEFQQRQTAYVQRQIEHLQEKLIEIQSPQLFDGSSSAEKEAKEKRDKLGDIIAQELDRLQNELKKTMQQTAKTSVELEILQMKLQRQQRRVEELVQLEQRRSQQELAPIAVPIAAEAPKKTDGKLEPHDTIRINVANSFADAPLNSVYTVEPMGTVALGPQYGRVDVKGLTVLEAETAITKHLAKTIEDPQVQVTMNEKQSTVRELEQLHAAINALQAENAALKQQLGQLKGGAPIAPGTGLPGLGIYDPVPVPARVK